MKQQWLSKLVRGAVLSLAVLASVATSRLARPQSSFQVDLITRATGVYALRAIDAPDGGFESLGLTLFAEQAASAGEDAAGPDGGTAPIPWQVRVARMDRQPTRQEVADFERGEAPGDLEPLGALSASVSSLTPFLPVTADPRWILFTRTGPGVLVTASMSPPCDEACGDLLLEDVTLNLP